MKVCRRTDKKFYFHLFNDCLLYSAESAIGYRLHHEFELQNCVVEDIGACGCQCRGDCACSV